MAVGGLMCKNSERYMFEKKDRMVRLGVFYSREFETMVVRMDLEGQ